MKRYVLLGLAVATLVWSGSYLFSADSVLDGEASFLREAENLVRSWEKKAIFALGVTLAIGLLGFLSGALQKFENAWTKGATAVGGIVIGCLTIVSNTVFEFDHRQFSYMAREGRRLLIDVKVIRAQMEIASQENRGVMFTDIQEKLREIYRLEEKPKIGASAINFISTAHAGGLPNWVLRPPSDGQSIYFIGIGDGRSYAVAKQSSKEKAVEEAVAYFVSLFEKSRKESKVNIESLSRFLLESAEVRDTYFTYDKPAGIYRFYTLLRLNKRIANVDLGLFAIEKKTPVPQAYSEVVQQAKRSPDDYASRRIDVYAKSLDSAKDSLTPDQYAKFLEARQLRKEKQYEKSISILTGLVRANSDFYLGWYNLALAYDEKKDFNAAKRAYERAIQLEPQQAGKDASVYNSYGFFLYSNQRYQEAIPQLRKALEIDPSHPKAKGTLQAAESAIRR